ncbi:hypothetical protein GDO81_015097 [Engystomops pustulosus]|uniref:Uncharacterized protein n=1 Tax=Engystomops pustulosus TaxID=76066 RepID=A0AAV7AL24_ENGPU|nr:hypothetical protein GDO81_015097 [Engystomops pustulosus]
MHHHQTAHYLCVKWVFPVYGSFTFYLQEITVYFAFLLAFPANGASVMKRVWVDILTVHPYYNKKYHFYGKARVIEKKRRSLKFRDQQAPQ